MTPDSSPSISRGAWLASAAGIFLAVLLAFWKSLDGEFVYDDLLVIQQNPQIASFANLPALFASSYWDFLDHETASHVGYYRPLTMVLITVAYSLGSGSPGMFHVFSLLVYGLSALAAWRFAVRLTKSETIGFWAGLLFALHPLHVESVAWISALHDPLFALFGFLSLNTFLRWRDEGSVGRPWLSGLWFFLALLSKDAAVALVPVALAIDWGRDHLGRTEGSRRISAPLRAFAPLAVAFAGYYLLRVGVFGGDPLAGFGRITTHFEVGAARLLLLRVELLGGAAWLLTWPGELNLFRPFKPELPLGDPSLLIGIAGSVVLLGGIAVAWVKRSRPMLAMLLLIPAGLAPALLSVQSLGTFPLSDRFLFVPVIGFTLLLATLAVRYLPRPVAIGLMLLVALGYGVRSRAQLPYWQNEEALFRRAIEQNPRNPNVYWGLGRVMLQRYRSEQQPEQLAEARANFDRSMDLIEEAQGTGTDIYATLDDSLQTNLGLGWTLLLEAEHDPFHDFETVRQVFERVIEFQPQSERGYIGLGLAWLGAGDPNEAGNALRRAIRINPSSPEAHFNMGKLLLRLQEWDSAAAEFQKCRELRNENLDDLVYLAMALQEGGEDDAARRHAWRASELYPRSPEPMIILGILDARERLYSRALTWFDSALALRPDHPEAHLQRGKVLAAEGRNQDAVAALQEAVRLGPENFQAHYNLAVLLSASSEPQAALPYFIRAYQLRPPQGHEGRLRELAGRLHENNPEILDALAIVDADRGNLDAAKGWARKSLEIDPERAPTKFILGTVLKQEKDYEGAAPLLLAAATELQDSYQAQMELADFLLEVRMEIAAKPYLIRASQLLPKESLPAELKASFGEKIQRALEEIEKLELKAATESTVPEGGE